MRRSVKCVDIHLRVNPRRVVALVPQQLTDLRQGRAGPEKSGGKAVPEDMGPLACEAPDASTLESGLGDHRDRASGCKADAGSDRTQKQPAARRFRATIAQVGGNNAANALHYFLRLVLGTIDCAIARSCWGEGDLWGVRGAELTSTEPKSAWTGR